jgi:hypothetical protein
MEYRSFHDWILKNMPKGSNMLEFGSGEGTKRFTENFSVTSIEHDLKYVGLDERSHYIHAPIVDNWYDTKKLQGLKSKHFDVILIDGPTGQIGRKGLLKNLHLFDWNATIVVDDINRPMELAVFKLLLLEFDHSHCETFKGIDREFGIIFNDIAMSGKH